MTTWQYGAGAGTHALVVGVGEYPWLLGGNQPTFAEHEGMGQLTSAPISALEFARWVRNEYSSKALPLRSLEVLVSAEGGPVYFEPKPGDGSKQLERATFDNYKNAVKAWRARLQPGDRAIFYFCGHGIGAGIQHTLLLEDYGCDPNSIMEYAHDFTRFHVAMARSPALTQCYFLDACRVGSDLLMQSLGDYGRAILAANASLPSPPRQQPVFYATMPGSAAYGRPNETSLFTEGLLLAMKGAGAMRRGASWVISPTSLYEGLQYHVDLLAAPYGATQSCLASSISSFDLHELGGPLKIPVIVRCSSPPIDLQQATITVTGAQGNRDQVPIIPQPWRLELPYGSYDFIANPPGGAPKSESVFPPYTEVTLP